MALLKASAESVVAYARFASARSAALPLPCLDADGMLRALEAVIDLRVILGRAIDELEGHGETGEVEDGKPHHRGGTPARPGASPEFLRIG
jgi:hypothetical protein